METKTWDVIVIGGGPAGLAAATAAHKKGSKVCIIERESRLGGILKQCIHDGFGVTRFKEQLTGPEYAYRCIKEVQELNIPVYMDTFLTKLEKDGESYGLTLVNSKETVFRFEAPAVVLAMGCRERSARQVFIHGTRPAGVYTAGLAQNFINIQGYMPGKKCVILGSGDIGLIMARRLTLEGAKVEGVYEVKSEPSGLTRNIVQCLDDYNIPLHLSTTVKEVHGNGRLEAVTVVRVDERFRPVEGTERRIECDTLILSVGLMPENDIIEPLGVEIDPRTKGPKVDQTMMTNQPGLFSCGNALHVNDLADFVSESGDIAGESAAAYAKEKVCPEALVPVEKSGDLLYVVPQKLDSASEDKTVCYFRSSKVLKNARVTVKAGDDVLYTRKFRVVKPPEMERIKLDLSKLKDSSPVTVHLEEVDA